ncbi:DJC10-like protein [Mya arenaria]|uniref:DnaJ homolog subfamily C member 10 n=1 Tax=Mya arenaria TaxID=6604 RepID=A0ABY7ELK9_MYAAR|nr:DJC10-like protein [Mya arenaria]
MLLGSLVRCLLALCVFVSVQAGEDFYELLGVPRGANDKEIRKAFKKIAVNKHPDKNPDDPEAHDKFLKITRAYEVLKDEDLRKKYDTHGEEGLSENFGQRKYESWKFYQEEFEMSVESTDDVWFWREVARELEGVVRIGAVNCEDEWQLCRMQQIQSYPSLIMYPGVRVSELWAGNFEQTVKHGENDLPWLISFCGDGGGVLDELVNVGTMDCHGNNEKLCETLGREYGTVFYADGTEITTLVAQEVANQVLSQLPDVTDLDETKFREVRKGLREGTEGAWLVHFVEGQEGRHLELRKLPAMLADINWCPPCMRLLPEFRKAARNIGEMVNFGTVDCTIHGDLCRTYNVRSYPTTIFYNQSKPHEYRGHHSVHALVEFIHQLVLNKGDDDIWLVDFYADWCGPCQQLAPEWRRLAKMMKQTKNVHVGMVECQEEQSLCQQQKVQSYPTLRLFPPKSRGGSYFSYNGWNRDADSLRAWAYEFLPSSVETVTYNSFQKNIAQSKDPWILDFYAPWCGHCQVFKPEFEKVAESLKGIGKAGKVDCTQEQGLCRQAGVNSYPTVRFYPGSQGGTQQNYHGWDIASQNAEEIIQFVKNNVPQKSDVHDEL